MVNGDWRKLNITSQVPMIKTPRKQEGQIIHSQSLNHTSKNLKTLLTSRQIYTYHKYIGP